MLIYLGITPIYAQKNAASLLNTFPKERVTLIPNSEVILSGQLLGYNTICSTEDGQRYISDIVYVEFISNDRTIIFKHKLKVEYGRAYGDFFLPTTLKTGHYKLIAYTQWTLNNKDQSFDQRDIYVINPYLNAAENNLKSNINEGENHIEILKGQNLNLKIDNQKNGLEITTDAESYKQRSKVELVLKNTLNNANFGYYSVNVRKVDSLSIKKHYTASRTTTNAGKTGYLPEMRGQLIQGTIINLKSNSPVIDQSVSLSVPGDNFIYKSTLTNENGEFYFNLHENFQEEKVILQVVSDKRDDYKINLKETGFTSYNDLEFYPLILNTNLKEYITQNSIYNQVESAYYDVKRDTINLPSPATSFYGKADVVYVLDDYTRFGSVKETFVEVIETAAVRTSQGNNHFFVEDFDDPFGNIYQNVKPLLLMDGIQIQDENIVLDYNVRDIESISTARGIYSLGSVIYNGIIDIKLKISGVLKLNDTSALYIEIQKPVSKKKYFKQIHNETNSRIPDYRTQLLWQPNYELNSSTDQIEFYTSDVPGIYLIELNGLSKEGKPIYLNRLIEVTKG